MSGNVSWTAVFVGMALVMGTVQAQTRLEKISVIAEDSEAFDVPVQVLIEEVAKRTGIWWPVSSGAGVLGSITFRSATPSDSVTPEGFRISTEVGDVPRITVIATDRLGALFAVG